MITQRVALYAAGAVAAVLALNWLLRGRLVREAAAAIPRAVGDAGAGFVFGVGDAVGVPRTDDTACAQALREGRLWDASFVCPAGDFLRGVVSPRVTEGTPEQGIPRIDIYGVP